MCSGDKKCPKKISILCSFFLAVLLSFFCALQPLFANALSPNGYSMYYNFYGYNDNQYQWSQRQAAGYVYNFSNVRRYEWAIDSVNFTGNYATIHFETNIVRHDIGYYTGRFTNLENLYVLYCGTGGVNGTIQSYSISTAKTVWYSNNNTIENQTLTVYGDVVVSGLQYSSGTHDIYCAVSTQDGEPFITSPNAGSDSLNLSISIEQSPTAVVFSNNLSDALNQDRNNILNNIDNSINNISNQYNQEKEDLENKESELNSETSNLSLSADTPDSSIVFRWFLDPWSVSNGCYTTTALHSWFNADAFTVCSIFPNINVRRAVGFASNFIVACLLIRIYAKHMKGGVNG